MSVSPPSAAGLGVHPRPRLLLVDDDPALLEVLADVFGGEGYVVETAPSAPDALRQLEGGPFDAIFSDIVMPGMDGLEFLRAVRRRDLDLPVVLLTGSPDLRTALAALEEGALEYLIKPVKGEALLRSAARAVGLSRLARLKRRALEHLGFDAMLLGDRAGLGAGFVRALGALWMAYQPILRASDGSLFGYEALLRSSDPLLTDVVALLDAGERLGRQRDLGLAVRATILTSIPAELRQNGRSLFINVQAEDLHESWTAPLLESGVPTVLEVTERATLRAIPDLQARVGRLRSQGLRIAIDDLGAGYAGLTSFAALEPDIVKIDMALVRNIDREPLKQKLVGSLTSVCRDLHILVVAEGIETEGERQATTDLGCDLLQGYLLGRPQALPAA